jgi:hypothetical protein
MLIDLEAGERNAYAIINTIRSIPGLQHTPLITLLDGENIELLSQTYDAGANLVIFWDKLEVRTGDIATLVVDNWLSTENEYPDDMRAHSG